MNKLSKARQTYKRKEADIGKDIGEYVIGSAGAGIGGAATSVAYTKSPAGTRLMGEALEGKSIKGAPKVTEKDIKTFRKKYKVEFVKAHDIPKGEFGVRAMPRFMPKAHRVAGPAGVHFRKKGPLHFALHELGHASQYKRLGRFRAPGMMAGTVAGALAMTSEDKRKYAPVLVGAGYAPMLADEAIASGKALKHIKKYHPTTVKPVAKSLVRAFGSYGAMAGGAVLGSAGVAALLSRAKKKKMK